MQRRADKGAAGDQGVFAGLFHRRRIAKPLTLGNADSAVCRHAVSRPIQDAAARREARVI